MASMLNEGFFLIWFRGCEKIQHHSMDEMKRLRTGENMFFPTCHDGWIRITTARI